MKVVAFDTGGTTGIAVGLLDLEKGLMRVSSSQEILSHHGIYNHIQRLNPDIIICEDFQYRNRARDGLELISAELNGVVKLYASEYKVTLYMQTPVEGIGGFYNDDRLKEHDLWQEGKIHANEATMHLLHWYTFKQGYKYNKEGFVKA